MILLLIVAFIISYMLGIGVLWVIFVPLGVVVLGLSFLESDYEKRG